MESVIVTGVRPSQQSPREVARDFRALLEEGVRLLPAGEARRDPGRLLERPYFPRHAVALFDATYFLTDFLFEEGLDFFVAYVGLRARGRTQSLHPRIFYKDSSLVWRVASHVVRSDGEDWIGKGDVKKVRDAEGEHLASDEDSTNLPYEIQGALDEISRRTKPRHDDEAIRLVLRNAPDGRMEPYADFSRPRERALEHSPIHGGKPVARITRRGDPHSLVFARGFAPDFEHGVLEVHHSGSTLYNGDVRKFRVASENGRVQYQFVASPTHVWINPPQAFTTELTTYGIRALHVPADEDIFVPGYEYHFVDPCTDPPEVYSQIPAGYAGPASPIDPDRADASPWIEELPVIAEFRARVLGAPARPARPK